MRHHSPMPVISIIPVCSAKSVKFKIIASFCGKFIHQYLTVPNFNDSGPYVDGYAETLMIDL